MTRRTIKTYHIAHRLHLIRVVKDEYAVFVPAERNAKLKVGRITRIREERAGNAAWLLAITGPVDPGAGIEMLGENADLEAAKSGMAEAFTVLIDWCDANRDWTIQWTIR